MISGLSRSWPRAWPPAVRPRVRFRGCRRAGSGSSRTACGCRWAAVKIVAENVRLAQQLLPVPLALEHIAALVEWPEAELDEAAFLTEILDRTGVLLLLDVANLYANARNHRYDPLAFLDRVPLERIAYVHVAGGEERDGVYHDTHAHAVAPGVLELLEELCARTRPPGVLLERDDDFPPPGQIVSELRQIRAAADRGSRRRTTAHDG